ncbi:MAG: hypothetical protein AAFU51_10330 [Bacteroidota bacterium]
MTFDLDRPLSVPNLWLRAGRHQRAQGDCEARDGTVSPYTDGDAVSEALRAAVRLRTGRRVFAPATTIKEALVDVEGYCVMPEWYDDAAELARETLRALYKLDGADDVQTWTLYTEAARRLGVPGEAPIALVPGRPVGAA